MATLLKIMPELRNLVINGNFDFWQRGTGVVGIGSGSYLPDRFQYVKSGTVVENVAQDGTVVPTLAESWFQSTYSYKNNVTTAQASFANAEFAGLSYVVEGYDYAHIHGKPFRFQFMFRSTVSGTYSVAFGNTGLLRQYVTTFTTVANTWRKVVIDVPANTSGSWSFGNTGGMFIYITKAAGAGRTSATVNSWYDNGTGLGHVAGTGQTNNVSAIGVAINIAQVALYPIQASAGMDIPFVRAGRTIGQELQMCQRYCEVWRPSDAFAHLGVVAITATNSGVVYLPYKVSKRSRPTSVNYTGTWQFLGASGSWTAFSFISDGQSVDVASISIAGTGFTGNTAGLIRTANDLTASFTFESEL